MAPRLNMNASDLGEIHPPFNGAQYVLNGSYFDGAGKFLFHLDEETGEQSADAPASDDPVSARLMRENDRLKAEMAELRAMVRDMRGGAPSPAPDAANDDEEETPPQPKGLMRASGGPTSDTESSMLPQAKDDPNIVDVRAWATGEAHYPFFKVRAAVARQYPDIVTSNSKTVMDGLIEKGVITADEAKG